MTTAPLLIAGREMPGCHLAAEWALEVRCDPVGDPRHQSAVRMKNQGKLAIERLRNPKAKAYFVSSYKPDTADAMKAAIAEQVRPLLARTGMPMPWPGAVRVSWTAYFAREGYAAAPSAPSFAFPHVVKPDRDNIDKAILDALTAAGVWVDDSRVFAGAQDKLWAAAGGGPGLRIWLEFIMIPWMPKVAKKKGATDGK